MKKIKTFSIAITMLFCYVSFGQEKIENLSVLLNPNRDKPYIIHCSSSIKKDIKPLYVLDGKITTENKMKKIDPNTIASTNVLKDFSATALYG